MSVRTFATPLGEEVLEAAYNTAGTRLATYAPGMLRLWRSGGESRRWAPEGSLALDEGRGDGTPGSIGDVRALAWAAPEHGDVLAVGLSDGRVLVFGPSRGKGARDSFLETQAVEQQTARRSPVTALAFDPSPRPRPELAVGRADGEVCFFSPGPGGGGEWRARDVARPEGADGGGRRPPAVCSVAFRPRSVDDPDGLPDAAAVGTADGRATLWVRAARERRWTAAAGLVGGTGEGEGATGDGSAAPGPAVAAVAWQQAHDGSSELVAVARGGEVRLVGLRGALDAPDTLVEATLAHSTPVWRLQWSLLGGWLAAGTEDGKVCLWRADLAGEWRLVDTVEGGG